MTKDAAAQSPKRENAVMGMPQSEYNAKASAATKTNIILWLISGLLFNLITGKLISLKTLLLFLPGVFVVSLVGIPFFYFTEKSKQRVRKLDGIGQSGLYIPGGQLPVSKQVPTLILATICQILDFLFPIVTAIFYASVV